MDAMSTAMETASAIDASHRAVSKVPGLLFSGALDGRTTIEGQKEAVSGLANLTGITVENAGTTFLRHPVKSKKLLTGLWKSAP